MNNNLVLRISSQISIVVGFGYSHIDLGEGIQYMTTCALRLNDPIHTYYGSAIMHPKDDWNYEVAKRTAFKRAAYQYAATLHNDPLIRKYIMSELRKAYRDAITAQPETTSL